MSRWLAALGLVVMVGCGPTRKQAIEWDVPANWGRMDKLQTREWIADAPGPVEFETGMDEQRRPLVTARTTFGIATDPEYAIKPIDLHDIRAAVIDDRGHLVAEHDGGMILPETRSAANLQARDLFVLHPGEKGKVFFALGEIPPDAKRLLVRFDRPGSETWKPIYWTLDIPADRTPRKGS